MRFFFGWILLALMTGQIRAQDWSQWRGSHRDGQWLETGIVESFDQLKPTWRQPVGAGYSSPTVVVQRVFLMDYVEEKKEESIKCFDTETGKLIWKVPYQAEYRMGYGVGPRAAVTVADGFAYSMGAMGHCYCVEVESGKVVWNKDLDAEYAIAASKRLPIWGMSCSPLLFKDKLILQIGAKDRAGVIALDRQTGEEVWRSEDDRGQYSSPVLTKQGGRNVAICWTGDGVIGLDPEDGSLIWRYDLKPTRMPIGVASPLIHGNRVLVTSFYDGAAMLELTDDMRVEEVWRKAGPNERATKAIHSIISTPIWIGSHVFGVDSYGQLRCLEAETGERVWEDLTVVEQKRWGTVHFVQNGDDVWMFNEQGELMVGRLTPTGVTIRARTQVLEPNQMRSRNRRDGVCWSHPAFARKSVFLRNDNELIRINLAADQTSSDQE